MPNSNRSFEASFTDVPGAVADIRAGRMVVDDEDRDFSAISAATPT